MKNNNLLKSGLIFVVLFGLAIFSFSCSPRDTTSPSGPAAQIRTVWAKNFGPGQLDAHYLKHKHEFPGIAKEEYSNRAKILLNSAAGKGILEKIRDNGDILHFRVSTGEFAVMARDGRIRTYFKTDYQYWSRQ
ncbi:hypothetical protein ACFL2J_03645 [Candidatus Omnitrophota bacterium]